MIPNRYRLADPNGIGSTRSHVNAKPICTSLDPIPCKRCLKYPKIPVGIYCYLMVFELYKTSKLRQTAV